MSKAVKALRKGSKAGSLVLHATEDMTLSCLLWRTLARKTREARGKKKLQNPDAPDEEELTFNPIIGTLG